jgi:ribonuclease G
VTREILWDAGPGEIRAGMVEDGSLLEFRLIRLRRTETALLQAGERFTTRLVERMGSGQALVDLGGGKQAVMQPCPAVPLGTLIDAEMARGPVPEPGRWKLPVMRALDTPASRAEPCWHFSAEPWELYLAHWADKVDAIICPDGQAALDAARATGGLGAAIRIDKQAIEEADFESLIESATTGDFAFPGGALKLERTRAMVMIDVDGTLPAHPLNRAAAAEIARLLRLLDIGGPVGIDFVSMSNRDERLDVAQSFDDAMTGAGPFERTSINGYGFCQIIRPRTRASIPETLCGTRVASLSDESRAIALLRAAGRSIGVGPRQLIGSPAVINLIKAWPEETAALRSALGVSIELVCDPASTGYGQVHVSPA